MPSLGLLARNTLWMTFGQGVRLVLQFCYFVLIARVLHRDGYGAFSGVVALTAIFFPFAGWGIGNLLIKNVVRDVRSFPVYWGRALVMITVSATGFTLLVLLLSGWILPASVSLAVVFWVALSDIFFTRVLEVAVQAFQAYQRLREAAVLSILYSGAKLTAVLLLISIHASNGLLAWAVLYMTSSALVALLAGWWVSVEFGLPRWRTRGWRGDFSEGFYFAASVSAQRIYMDSDKALLTHFATLDAAGIYAAGARVVDVVLVPVYSLLSAAYARFFQHGSQGLGSSYRFAVQLMPFALAYAVLAAVCLNVFAPAIPWLLGAEFVDTVSAVRWLSLVPLLMTLHRFAADSLTGAGHQRLRTSCEFGAAVINVLINVALIPAYGWRGAAVATLGTEMLLVLGLWTALGWGLRKERQTGPVDVGT